jgi:uncharacterized protein
MKASGSAFLSGVLFAVGLSISGMVNPDKVIAFLDVTGAWDPSLLGVMVSAILVYAIAYSIIRRREQPLLSAQFLVPKRTGVDASLVVGSVIFGVGWGLGGYCPGPSLVSLGVKGNPSVVFVVGLLVGMAAYSALPKLRGFTRARFRTFLQEGASDP